MLEILSIFLGLALFLLMLFGAVSALTKNHKQAVFSPPCPVCGKTLPAVRRPSNLRQAMWGGWTCSHCQAEVGRGGQLIKQAANGEQRGGLSMSKTTSSDGSLSMAQEGQLSDAEVEFDFESKHQTQQDQHAQKQHHVEFKK